MRIIWSWLILKGRRASPARQREAADQQQARAVASAGTEL